MLCIYYGICCLKVNRKMDKQPEKLSNQAQDDLDWNTILSKLKRATSPGSGGVSSFTT